MLLIEFLLSKNRFGALGHFALLILLQYAIAFARFGILLSEKQIKSSNFE
jgi:hypothetical protein